MSRKREQAELIFKAGEVLGPLLKLAASPISYDADERNRIVARYFAERQLLVNEVNAFARGEQGHLYVIECGKAAHSILQLGGVIEQSAIHDPKMGVVLKGAIERFINAILSIPVPVDSTIHAAKTPFTTYCLIKDLCSTAAKQIVWLDRYFDQSIFHRYFSDVPAHMQVTLITWPRSQCNGKRDETRYDEFMDVSRLFAQERGPQGYRLIVDQTFHDRWLRCDDKLLQLGGSIKDIGKAATFTVSRLDSTPDNLKQFDEPLARGTEVFGPNNPVHP